MDAAELAIRKAVLTLAERVLLKKVDATSVYALIQEAWAVVKEAVHLDADTLRAVFKTVLQRVAAGVDGVAGTADDLIPPATVKRIVALVDGQVMDDLLDILDGPVRAACPCLPACFRSNKNKVSQQPAQPVAAAGVYAVL